MAAELLKNSHPLHNTFLTWLEGKEPTKRQARKFLAAHPRWNEALKRAA